MSSRRIEAGSQSTGSRQQPHTEAWRIPSAGSPGRQAGRHTREGKRKGRAGGDRRRPAPADSRHRSESGFLLDLKPIGDQPALLFIPRRPEGEPASQACAIRESLSCKDGGPPWTARKCKPRDTYKKDSHDTTGTDGFLLHSSLNLCSLGSRSNYSLRSLLEKCAPVGEGLRYRFLNRYPKTETNSHGHEHRVKERFEHRISCLACIFLTISPAHHFL